MLGFRGLALNYTEFLILAPSVIFFFNDTATTEIYTLSLHDALPISEEAKTQPIPLAPVAAALDGIQGVGAEDGQRRHLVELGRLHRPLQLHRKGHRRVVGRSEEHTSELQSQSNLVCRLLLEKEILESVRRLNRDLTTRKQQDLTGRARNLLSLFRKNQDVINIVAYVAGSNDDIDRAISMQIA